jgi:hypothetical protein
VWLVAKDEKILNEMSLKKQRRRKEKKKKSVR